MQTARILQAVIFMMIVAIAASCAASKEYTSKLFTPRTPATNNNEVAAAKPLRFLELDSATANQDDWVTTDIIMGRDTMSTFVLDNFAKTFPANPIKKDTVIKAEPVKTGPQILVEKKVTPEETVPVARNANPGEVRSKKSRDSDK